ncbi:MAG TPA: YihY/virulence factor BrkB family protein [Steroidobacteraceae bacterium]|jgi:membrane protein|nr:YihY/virulence factor BrkB family protein [Steroidobacteraceae bacterium]
MLNISAWLGGCAGQIWALIKDAATGWSAHRASRIGAALAFYTVFSLGPILLLAVVVAGFFFGESAARGEIHQQISTLIGAKEAAEVQMLLARAHRPEAGLLATTISVVTLLFSADIALVELKAGLDEIWSVPGQTRRWYWDYLQTRLLTIALILSLGFLLLASLLFSAALGALEALSRGIFIVGVVLRSTSSLISFGLAVLLFATVYKVLPSVRLAWKDVATGALITAVLFTVGKYAIGLYLGSSSVASTYGAAGSVIVVLLWVYYSAQVFLFGAELTRGYACRFGSRRGMTGPMCPEQN